MNNKYEIKDILSAIDVLLNNKEKEVMRLVSEVDVEKPFLLKDKAKKSKKKMIVCLKIQKKLFCKQKNI